MDSNTERLTKTESTIAGFNTAIEQIFEELNEIRNRMPPRVLPSISNPGSEHPDQEHRYSDDTPKEGTV